MSFAFSTSSISSIPRKSFGNIKQVLLNKKYVPSTGAKFIRWSTTDEALNNEDDLIQNNDKIKEKRNFSHLHPHHYRREHGLARITDEHDRKTMPLWQYRKLYGRYGEASGIDTHCLWPSKKEMELAKEREILEFPHSVQEMMSIALQEKEDEHDAKMERQENILKNMKELEKWKKTVRLRIENQEKTSKIAMARKQKQIDEVRKIFGYYIDPKDEKFREALEKKEEEDRKREKKEKKLRKQQRDLERLQAIAMQGAEDQIQKEDDNMGKPVVKGMKIPSLDDNQS